LTLIQNIHFGNVMTVMTSDTRQTSNIFGITRRYKDAENKVGRLSPYCVFGGGGATMLVDAIKDEVSGGAKYIVDFKPLLERAIDVLKKREHYEDFFENEESAQILISGFNEDGSSGFLSYNTGKGQEVEYTILELYQQEFHIISPSVDEQEAALKVAVMPPVNSLEELTEAAINYALQIQNAFYTNDEETVSEKFNYCAIYNDQNTGEFKCYEGQIDLSNLNT
jgi:hypothetical protein